MKPVFIFWFGVVWRPFNCPRPHRVSKGCHGNSWKSTTILQRENRFNTKNLGKSIQIRGTCTINCAMLPAEHHIYATNGCRNSSHEFPIILEFNANLMARASKTRPLQTNHKPLAGHSHTRPMLSHCPPHCEPEARRMLLPLFECEQELPKYAPIPLMR